MSGNLTHLKLRAPCRCCEVADQGAMRGCSEARLEFLAGCVCPRALDHMLVFAARSGLPG